MYIRRVDNHLSYEICRLSRECLDCGRIPVQIRWGGLVLTRFFRVLCSRGAIGDRNVRRGSLFGQGTEDHRTRRRRAVAPRAARASCVLFEGRSELFEIDYSGQLFEWIPQGRYLVHISFEILEANLFAHPTLQRYQSM